jgi:hypothetical protein
VVVANSIGPKGDYSGNTPKLKEGNKDLLNVSMFRRVNSGSRNR